MSSTTLTTQVDVDPDGDVNLMLGPPLATGSFQGTWSSITSICGNVQRQMVQGQRYFKPGGNATRALSEMRQECKGHTARWQLWEFQA